MRRLELNSLLRDLGQLQKGNHLESTTVGQKVAVPSLKDVCPSTSIEQLLSRPKTLETSSGRVKKLETAGIELAVLRDAPAIVELARAHTRW